MAKCPHCNEEHPDELVVCPNTDMVISRAERPPDPMIGTILDNKYKIDDKLGEGGMGAVYTGEHLMMKRRVAIKTLLSQFTTNSNAVQRFQREAQAASNIGHPNIITIHDLGQTPDGMLYIVMEHLDGCDLGQEVKNLADRGQMLMEPQRAMEVMRQVAEGLAAAHEKGVVHRDLKPDNIFMTPGRDNTDRVKLLDFGISKIRSPSPDQARLTTDGSLLGTPYYMSPEQAQGKSDIDHRADIYAYGVILYELMTGRVPFEDDNMLRVIAMHALEEPLPPRQINPNIPESIELVIAQAMAKDPNVRFQTMNDVINVLKAAGEGVNYPVTSPGFAAQGSSAGFQSQGTGAGVSGSVPGTMVAESWGGATTPPPGGSTMNSRFGGANSQSWTGAGTGTGSTPGVSATPMSWSDNAPSGGGGLGVKIAIGAVVGVVVLGMVIGGIVIAVSSSGSEVAQNDPPLVTTPAVQPQTYPTPQTNPVNPYPTQNPQPTYPTNPNPMGAGVPNPVNPYPTAQTNPVPSVPTTTKVTVRIESSPTKSKVYDGALLLGETPYMAKVERGTAERSLLVRREGYEDKVVSFTPDHDRIVSATLKRARRVSSGRTGGRTSGRTTKTKSSTGRTKNSLLKQMPTF